MPDLLIRKLEQFTRLSALDKSALDAAAGEKRRRIGPREDIIREGDNPGQVNLILDGWACRYKQLRDGRQQIISFFLPGDLCDTHVHVLRRMDHSIGALTPVTFAEISRETLARVTAEHPRITQALWWDTLVAAAIQREWTVNLGRRIAAERLGHLLCEIFIRLRGVGLTEGHSCVLPVTQADLGDAMGLSNVHINRTLQELRGSGLIVLKGRQLTIPNLNALMRDSLFNPNYLHLDRVGRHLDANEASSQVSSGPA
ncbi:Crp/Fnr family transcriptional regulator [uncultured Methylobacterium sp.]|jgi:CRP-like cAMP-binding protein|uniref:Crp/Fnr family transcriptional regulator n=1 Tax=uncultured Methylobacterium sp. TaxID=157278 RepID=UPI002624B6DE|nr:Crp/Fnr family transcriptional regulator [uncultured Methylobacterium sp.]